MEQQRGKREGVETPTPLQTDLGFGVFKKQGEFLEKKEAQFVKIEMSLV